ncbi:hypothetical protein [Demequina subtropica]|uniref:hypothetical protein n=1 Tax=Demequina subtropica TaxID=1638989 RepID=UPI000780D980|nr:hypothetical protein [Demequina subtropica]
MELWLADGPWTAAVMVAAIDAGLVDVDTDRVLLVASCAEVPEVAHWWTDEPPAFLDGRFRAVLDLNAAMEPYHPAHYAPPSRNKHDLVDAIVAAFGAHDVTRLVVPSLTARPASTLLDLFTTSPVTLFSCDVAAWTRDLPPAPASVAFRVTGHLAVPLVPGARMPRLGLEFDPEEIPASAVAATVPDDASIHPDGLVIADTDPFLPDALERTAAAAALLAAAGCASVAVALAHPGHDSRHTDVRLALAAQGTDVDVIGWGPRALAAAARPGVRTLGAGSTALLATAMLGARAAAAVRDADTDAVMMRDIDDEAAAAMLPMHRQRVAARTAPPTPSVPRPRGLRRIARGLRRRLPG